MASLNPALEDVRFCPRCAQLAEVSLPRELRCDACGLPRAVEPGARRRRDPARRENGRIWLLRRTQHEGAGRWTFPGGYVELGESVEDAAVRETREELDKDIELGDLVGVYAEAS
jgi:8-oxo-dGTP pyrophosphatase MutT (NUDIX family)